MQRIIFMTICAVMVFSLPAYSQTKMDTLSYSLGVLLGKNLKDQGFTDLKAEDVAKGINDLIQGGELKIDAKEANQIVGAAAAENQARKAEAANAEGAAFLAKNGKRAEVTTTASGLQYEILVDGGNTEKPSRTSRVTVHYRGTLLNGDQFDSSYDRGEPATFGVTQVIGGWTEALQLMSPGDKYKLYIPYDLAYGDRGAGGKIGPYETLIFEVELISIQ